MNSDWKTGSVGREGRREGRDRRVGWEDRGIGLTSGFEMDRGIEVDGSFDSGLVTNVVFG